MAPRSSAGRLLLVSLVSGAAWALALGFVVLAPRLLTNHHFHAESAAHWLAAIGWFAAAFSVVGVTLAALGTVVPVLIQVALRRGFARPALANALIAGPALVVAYLGLSGVIEQVAFGQMPGLEPYRGAVVWVLAGFLLAVASLVALYRWAPRVSVSVRHIVTGILLVGAVAAATLPLRVAARAAAVRTSPDGPVAAAAGTSRQPPLLLVGIDSGNWRVFDPLIDRGELPTLARLRSQGLHGSPRALWPPYWSAPAWAAIVTGKSIEETGVYEDVAVRMPGLPLLQLPLTLDLLLDPLLLAQYSLARADWIQATPPPRAMLRQEPVWETLTRAGKRVAVVRFRFVFPADGQAAVLLSDWVGPDAWKYVGMEARVKEGLSSPPDLAMQFMELFDGNASATDALLEELWPAADRMRPAGTVLDTMDVLRTSARIDAATLQVTERLIAEHPDLDAVLVYLGGFDTVCHALWPYRFAADYPDAPPTGREQQALGPVLDRYAQFLDRGIGRLAASFAGPPTVLVVSDHGHEAKSISPVWRGAHGPVGMFLLAGPTVQGHGSAIEVSPFDVTPTVLRLVGLPPAPALVGRALPGGEPALATQP